MKTLEDIAVGEAVKDVTGALLLAAGDAIDRHSLGDGPDDAAIVAAGFSMAINAISDKMHPNFGKMVRDMIK